MIPSFQDPRRVRADATRLPGNKKSKRDNSGKLKSKDKEKIVIIEKELKRRRRRRSRRRTRMKTEALEHSS